MATTPTTAPRPSPVPALSCRPFADTDTPALVDAVQAVHAAGGLYPPAQDLGSGTAGVRAWLREDLAVARWVLEAGGRVVGHVLVAEPHTYLTNHLDSQGIVTAAGSLLEVGKLFVSPAARGTGGGARLLRTARAYAHEHDRRLALAVVSTSRAARRLYQREGMLPAGDFHGIHGLNYVLLDPAPPAPLTAEPRQS